MILPPDELKDFSFYKHDTSSSSKYDFRLTDIVTLHYVKSIFGFKYRYRREFIFRRNPVVIDGKNMNKETNECNELRNQLHKIVNKTWTSLDTKLYNELETKHPEYFL